MCLCVARACRHHLSSVHPYRVGVQSEPGCSSPFYLPTYGLIDTRPSRNRSLVVQQSILHTARALPNLGSRIGPQVTCGAKLRYVSRPRRADRAAAADPTPVRGAPGAERAASARVWLAHRRAVTLPRVASPLPAGAQAAQASSNWSLGKCESVPLAPGTDPALHPDLLLFTCS